MMYTVLEVLEQTEWSLNGREPADVITAGDWDFNNWNKCTCGHIYAAVLGRKVTDFKVSGQMATYEAASGPHVIPDEFCRVPDDFYRGLPATLRAHVTKHDTVLYLDTLAAVAKANGLSCDDDEDLAWVVSHGTQVLCTQWYGTTRGEDGEANLLRTARRMVRTTIDALTAQYEEDRAGVVEASDGELVPQR